MGKNIKIKSQGKHHEGIARENIVTKLSEENIAGAVTWKNTVTESCGNEGSQESRCW